uniref:Leucine rich immune protein (Coil-less) n=1 Tax=Anopheles epiroticus TaxID=199890 RepID=A0A182PQG1_9DIPT
MNIQCTRNVLALIHSNVHSITHLQCAKGDRAKPLPSTFCGSDSNYVKTNRYHVYLIQNYTEHTFTVQDNGTYEMYFLYEAPLLRYVYIQHNLKVSLVHIETCSLVRVPRTIRNVPNVRDLILKWCRIRQLDLSDFVDLHSLYVLDLTGNQILSIVALPTGSAIPIHRLYLANNTLHHLNVSVLGGLQELRCLVLESNRIEAVVTPVVLPKLEELSLRNNRLSALNCTDWYLPALKYFFCSNNRLASAPIEWQSMWRMLTLDLSFNRLHSFRMDDIYLTQLLALNLAANELTDVVTTQRHLRVPLGRLQLAQNRLTELDISRWGMPNLWELNVNHNRLTELGDVFVRFPSLGPMMILPNNPWSCEWLNRVHPTDLRRKNYGCLDTNDTCPVGRVKVLDGGWICCW